MKRTITTFCLMLTAILFLQNIAHAQSQNMAEYWIVDLIGKNQKIEATFKKNVAIKAGNRLYLQDGRPSRSFDDKRNYCVLTAENWLAEDWWIFKGNSAEKDDVYSGNFDDQFTSESGSPEFFNNTLMEYNTFGSRGDPDKWVTRDLITDLPLITTSAERIQTSVVLLNNMIDVDKLIIANLSTYDDMPAKFKKVARDAELKRFQKLLETLKGIKVEAGKPYFGLPKPPSMAEQYQKQLNDQQVKLNRMKKIFSDFEAAPIITLHLSSYKHRPGLLDLECHFKGNDYEPKLSDIQNIVGRTIGIDLPSED